MIVGRVWWHLLGEVKGFVDGTGQLAFPFIDCLIMLQMPYSLTLLTLGFFTDGNTWVSTTPNATLFTKIIRFCSKQKQLEDCVECSGIQLDNVCIYLNL